VQSDDEDRRLVTAYLESRDDAAFRKLYRRHTTALYTLAIRLVAGRRADAEDVIQDTWLRAMAAIERFQWRSSLRTWLCGFVVNCAREAIRGRLPFHEEAGTEPKAVAQSSGEYAIDMQRAIAMLPEGYRTVIVLHDVQGFAHSEIADILGIDEGTSKNQLFNARRAMRSLMQGGSREQSTR
jgi:RNA polymerase sigma-70 factor, ECF subfamily